MNQLPKNISIQFARYDPDQMDAWVAMLSEEEHLRFADFKSVHLAPGLILHAESNCGVENTQVPSLGPRFPK